MSFSKMPIYFLFAAIVIAALIKCAKENPSANTVHSCQEIFDKLCKQNPLGYKRVEAFDCKVEGYCDIEPPRPPKSVR